ncbi:hypothetical protein COO91_03447 [Nostoc flagelliforme CCNUN1]|uniref:Uncharacterized protein n=1 Tax=Nostoc flagelliforme CCNUN1 TaxID=2038116 RepID=A0A2K8SPW5_9NOSO|nr:hypothetical protein COO91_03447 [Nostoc flagelliforme CCNUN1]
MSPIARVGVTDVVVMLEPQIVKVVLGKDAWKIQPRRYTVGTQIVPQVLSRHPYSLELGLFERPKDREFLNKNHQAIR